MRSAGRGTVRSAAPVQAGRPGDAVAAGLRGYRAPVVDRPDAVLCDLDGVVWLAGAADPRIGRGDRPTAGVAGAGSCSSPTARRSTIADQNAALAAIGIPADRRRAVVGDRRGGAARRRRRAGARLRRGGRHRGRGARPGPRRSPGRRRRRRRCRGRRRRGRTPPRLRLPADAHRHARPCSAAPGSWRRNDDPTYPTPDGPDPGRRRDRRRGRHGLGGSSPTVAGKPYRPMAAPWPTCVGGDLADPALADRIVMVGDRRAPTASSPHVLGCRVRPRALREHAARRAAALPGRLRSARPRRGDRRHHRCVRSLMPATRTTLDRHGHEPDPEARRRRACSSPRCNAQQAEKLVEAAGEGGRGPARRRRAHGRRRSSTGASRPRRRSPTIVQREVSQAAGLARRPRRRASRTRSRRS